jgi:hypothetical protein
MLTQSRTANVVVGVALLLVLVAGLGLIAAGWHIRQTYRHVVVEMSNLDDSGQVAVNCQLAGEVGPRPNYARVDLGWLDPNDRVYLSSRNELGDAAWGFVAESNGRKFFDGHRGDAGTAGIPADDHAVTMAEGFTAAGDPLGTVGCQPPLGVSPTLAKYRQADDDADVAWAQQSTPQWSARTFPFAAIDGASRWALAVLAVVGIAAAAATPSLRHWIREHWKIGGLIAIVGIALELRALLGTGGVLVVVQLIGVALLIAACWNRLVPIHCKP